jgi:hypothetical protein
MAKIKNCKSCSKEVASSAKVCPHCGQKLKMGMMAKLGILIVILIGVGIASMPSDDEIKTELANIEKTSPAKLTPSGELGEMFSMMSKNTDIQRDNMEKEINGKIVQWTLTVFEVSVANAEKGIYKIQTTGKGKTVGTFVEVHARDAGERSKIEALTTGDKVTIKGKITDTFMRNIRIKLARLVK